MLVATAVGPVLYPPSWTYIPQFTAACIPRSSPLRNTHSLFWGTRASDEGVPRPKGFHSLVNAGKIEIVSPARVVGFVRQVSDVLEKEHGEEGGVVVVVKKDGKD